MNTRRCLKIADRINALLLRELRQGIDRQRMVAEPLYARDVLLVCEAFPGSDLASLAKHFRAAAAEVAETPSSSSATPSGFSASRFLSSIFGPLSTLDPPPEKPAGDKRRSWFGGR
ncbi:MAG: hypothetical protein KA141_11260 [Rubrivivax sp.]|jgi:hypothetical protein|nr:hypothetical protein [Rubrivivax sp.]